MLRKSIAANDDEPMVKSRNCCRVFALIVIVLIIPAQLVVHVFLYRVENKLIA